MDRRTTTDLSDQTVIAAAFFEWLPDAYLILDKDFRVVLANQRYFDLLGVADDDLVGRSVLDINQHGSARQRKMRALWLTQLLTRLRPGKPLSTPFFRYDVPAKGDALSRTRVWKLDASLITLPGQVQSYFALRVSDVTTQTESVRVERQEKARLRSQARLREVLAREAEERLEESRAALAQALIFAKIGAWQLDMSTGEIACTDQCKLNMGIGIDQPLSESRLFDEIIHPDDRERVGEVLKEALAEHRSYEAEYRLADAPDRWVLAGGRARYDSSGAPASMSGFTLDITARKQEELAQRQIATEQREAREESDRNALAMDHFLTAVTHELRSPIGVILNWAELLRHAPASVDLERASAVLERNARQLSLMVEDLLDSGAIVSGKLSIHPARMSLDQLVRDVVGDLKSLAERKGLHLLMPSVESVEINGDEARIKQIVWNLLTNAIKFCDSGHIEVRLAANGPEAVLKVRDTGCGIAPEAIERVFERFEQVRQTSPTRISGLGLGLWLVRGLVEQHGGRVEAFSAGTGQGTTFTVRLPRVTGREGK